jgi:hypothetical protein
MGFFLGYTGGDSLLVAESAIRMIAVPLGAEASVASYR